MELPAPPQAVVALAAFIRDRLAEASARGTAAIGGAATVIVGAAAPFAPTSYSRARLIRQMHASGLLNADEVRRTRAVLGDDADLRSEPGAPR
jgi:O-antigen ligase